MVMVTVIAGWLELDEIQQGELTRPLSREMILLSSISTFPGELWL